MTAVEDRPPAPRRVPSSRRPIRRRPAPRPRAGGSWGRRILAVVALLAIGSALYLINATFQPFHGDGTGEPVQVTIPEDTDAGTIGDLLAAKGVVASGGFFELNATLTGRRGSLRPGEYTLTARHELRRRDRRAREGPEGQGRADRQRHGAGGPLDPRGGAAGRQGAAEGQLPQGGERAARAAPDPPARRAARHPHGRGLPVPGHLHAGRRQPGARPGDQAARRVPATSSARRHALRQAQEPHALRRAHHRLDDRARGADRPRAPAHRGRDLQPPGEGSRSGSTPRSATRSATGSGRCRSASSRRSRPTTRARPAACRRRRSATPAASRSRRPPTRRARTTCSTWSSRAARARTPSRRPTPSSSATSRPTSAQREELADALARRLLTTYLGVCGWPVAHSRSPQMHNAALAAVGLDGLALPAPAAAARAVRGDGAGAAGGRLPRRQRDDPAQAGRAGARRRGDGGGAGDRRGEHADLRGRARSRPTTPTRRACSRRSASRVAGRTALVLGAGGAGRAAAWALRDRGGATWRSGTAPPSGPRELAAELGVRAVTAPSRPTSSSTARRSGFNPARGPVQGAPDRGR